jgi:CubicO group peptidase (beta-lactamase class C family)
MKNVKIDIILILCIIQLIGAQTFQETDPVNVGIISTRLDRIDSVINKSVSNGEIPGAVALIARNGKIAYHKSFGYADLDAKKRMANNSIFRIASMSKAIVTVGVMVLYERGYFMLNDPISNYIPEFKNPKILVEADTLGNVVNTKPSKKEIRIIDLLTHSSGISHQFANNILQKVYLKAGLLDHLLPSEEIVLESQIKLLSTQPLLFEPGSKWEYGLNTDVLGYLCEIISGKSLDRFLNDEIFMPLKMYDTYFYLPNPKRDRLVTMYSWLDGKGLVVSKGDESWVKLLNPNYPIEGQRTYFSACAGLSSTAYDYGRFIQMLLNNGELEGNRIISRKSIELMRSARIDRDDDGKVDFGFGFAIIDDVAKVGELASEETYSWLGAFYTSYWIDPKENLIAVFMSQVIPCKTDISDKFQTLVYQAIK